MGLTLLRFSGSVEKNTALADSFLAFYLTTVVVYTVFSPGTVFMEKFVDQTCLFEKCYVGQYSDLSLKVEFDTEDQSLYILCEKFMQFLHKQKPQKIMMFLLS